MSLEIEYALDSSNVDMPAVENQCDTCDRQRDRTWRAGIMRKTCSVCNKAVKSAPAQKSKRKRSDTIKVTNNTEELVRKQSSQAHDHAKAKKSHLTVLDDNERQRQLIELRGDTDSEPEQTKALRRRQAAAVTKGLKAMKAKVAKEKGKGRNKVSVELSTSEDSDTSISD